jgi:hypothetical protein
MQVLGIKTTDFTAEVFKPDATEPWGSASKVNRDMRALD